VWHNATPEDRRRISADFSYFPRFLSDRQQHILLNAALGRLDHVGSHWGSHASRRKRKRLLLSLLRSTGSTDDTDTDTDTSLSPTLGVGAGEGAGTPTFLPDEYYDFEQVSSPQSRVLALS
jgi:hypothetical protein